MTHGLKQRLVGAAVLAALLVIFLPMLLDDTPQQATRLETTNIPPKPPAEFSSRIVPLDTTPPPQPAAAPQPPAPSPSAATAAAPAAPASGPASASPPVSAAPSPAAPGPAEADQQRLGVTAWVVQLGSFSSEQNARDLETRLRKQGYNAFVEKLYSTDGAKFRVRVGPELIRSKAQDSRDRIEKDLNLKGIVVRYP